MGWVGLRKIGLISTEQTFLFLSRPGRARSKVHCMNSGREYNSRPLFMREQ